MQPESSASTRLCCCGCSVSVAQNAVKMPRDRRARRGQCARTRPRTRERAEGRKQARKRRKHGKSLFRGPKWAKMPQMRRFGPQNGQKRAKTAVSPTLKWPYLGPDEKLDVAQGRKMLAGSSGTKKVAGVFRRFCKIASVLTVDTWVP